MMILLPSVVCMLSAILRAIGQSLDFSDNSLIERKTQEHYLSEKYAGDEDYHVTVLTPALFCKLTFSPERSIPEGSYIPAKELGNSLISFR